MNPVSDLLVFQTVILQFCQGLLIIPLHPRQFLCPRSRGSRTCKSHETQSHRQNQRQNRSGQHPGHMWKRSDFLPLSMPVISTCLLFFHTIPPPLPMPSGLCGSIFLRNAGKPIDCPIIGFHKLKQIQICNLNGNFFSLHHISLAFHLRTAGISMLVIDFQRS